MKTFHKYTPRRCGNIICGNFLLLKFRHNILPSSIQSEQPTRGHYDDFPSHCNFVRQDYSINSFWNSLYLVDTGPTSDRNPLKKCIFSIQIYISEDSCRYSRAKYEILDWRVYVSMKWKQDISFNVNFYYIKIITKYWKYSLIIL